MRINSILHNLACCGILVSAAFPSSGVGGASELAHSNATRVVSKAPQELPQTQGDQRGTTATADGDDDDNSDENRMNLVPKVATQIVTKDSKALEWNLQNTKQYFYNNQVHKIDLEQLFEHTKFQDWKEKTLKIYEQNEEEAYDSMLWTMRNHWSNKQLAALLEGSSSSSTPKTLLQEAELKYWKSKSDSTQFFKLLQLRREGSQLLNCVKLEWWLDFAFVKKELPIKRLFEILNADGSDATLPKGYSDAELVELLRAPRTETIAQILGPDLEEMLLAKWNSYPVANVLHNLGLRQPEIDYWLAYILRTAEKVSYEAFTSKAEFNAEKIARMIDTMVQSKDSTVASIGKTAQHAQLEKWKQDGWTGNDLFDALNLKKEGLTQDP